MARAPIGRRRDRALRRSRRLTAAGASTCGVRAGSAGVRRLRRAGASRPCAAASGTRRRVGDVGADALPGDCRRRRRDDDPTRLAAVDDDRRVAAPTSATDDAPVAGDPDAPDRPARRRQPGARDRRLDPGVDGRPLRRAACATSWCRWAGPSRSTPRPASAIEFGREVLDERLARRVGRRRRSCSATTTTATRRRSPTSWRQIARRARPEPGRAAHGHPSSEPTQDEVNYVIRASAAAARQRARRRLGRAHADDADDAARRRRPAPQRRRRVELAR